MCCTIIELHLIGFGAIRTFFNFMGFMFDDFEDIFKSNFSINFWLINYVLT